jgi:hypothetical protein
MAILQILRFRDGWGGQNVKRSIRSIPAEDNSQI